MEGSWRRGGEDLCEMKYCTGVRCVFVEGEIRVIEGRKSSS
jgi:hypothetical protein